MHRLAFIRRARDLGFSIEEIRNVLQLWGDQERSSADVKALTLAHIKELEQKIAALKEMRDTLRHLVHECDGDHRPDCRPSAASRARCPAREPASSSARARGEPGHVH